MIRSFVQMGWHLVILAFVLNGPVIHAQQSSERTITITEPGKYSIRDLYKLSDTVAVVEITAADAESYPKAVYRARVVTSFKGAAEGQIVYFGPFIGTKLGWQYVVFLQNAKLPISPTKTSSPAFGTVPYSLVFNEGYSSMEISYESVFPVKGDDLGCDYGVRVCTDYITLPQSTSVSPSMDDIVPFGCRWIKKPEFLSLIETLSK